MTRRASQAIDVGMGIGLLPQVIIASCEQVAHLPPVRRVLPEYAMSGAALTVLTPSGAKLPRRVSLLRDFLVQKLLPRCEKHGCTLGIAQAPAPERPPLAPLRAKVSAPARP